MGKEDLVSNNPLRVLGLETDEAVDARRVGLVMARAGLGKTAILVQIAMDAMLRDNKVLHVAIGEGIDKTRTWYDDILTLINDDKKIENFQNVVDDIMKNRMIMTFKENSFSLATLEERMEDLSSQEIFKADCLIVDGFDFSDVESVSVLNELNGFMDKNGLKMVWFSAVSHRGDERVSANGVPAPCHECDELFDTVLLISPEDNEIRLKTLKCSEACSVDAGKSLSLDPATMLLKKA
ncbi:MAG: hypothetical protein JKY62_17155 [Desulfocapsa sp.]|uniref:Cytoplasmic protein n=1 Tax=Desulfotalea psychrophila TaxID=84980 RepID=A0ABS3AUJ9_9BACT|nr:hypothetical protein [Desulfocapsa sp.]MBN4045957.1 hypothetical protein [bacterium AH-315-P11]MBN4060146.1 hypothetical protein [Desulfotalea psychrophila]MBN4068773.1 hypothetical protein [Desulfotalea psychrophila]